MKILAFIISLLSVFLYYSNTAAANHLTIQLGTEGGYYNSETLGNRLLTRLIGRLNFTNTFDKNFIILKGRVAPELYGLSFAASTIKLAGQMNFGQRRQSFTWQMRLSTRNYYYQSDQYSDVSFNVFQVGGDLTKAVDRKLTLGTAIDYFYRDSSRQPRNQLDSYSMSPFVTYQIGSSNYLSFEINIEQFKIKKSYSQDGLTHNSGWRIGPKLSFKRRSSHIFNFSYQLIRHASDIITNDHWENRIDVLWGKILTKKWSVFFYLNYQIRPDLDENVPIELTYTPVNNENWIHLKAGYDISRKTELYAKFGYTKDELIYNNQDLSGWQFLFGLNLKY